MRRLAISGAGVGGLAAAIALARGSGEPTVFERSPAPRDAGGPIWLYENALDTLDELGLGEKARAAGTLIERHSYRDWRGREIGLFPLAELGRRRGAPTQLLMIARNALDAVLRSELDAAGVRVRFGTPIAGYAPVRGGVRLMSGPAMTSTGDVFDGLVGADGARSAVRSQLLGAEPLYARYMAWTGLADGVHWPYPTGESVTYLGDGYILIAGADGRPGPSDRVLWVAIGPRATVEEVGRRWPEPIPNLLRQTAEPVPFQIRDRDPRWHGRGPVTLLGDAAHPMMPAPGQGACQAIEDAAVLARALDRRPSVESALRSYEEARRRRVPRIWRFARSVTLMMLTAVPSAAYQVGLRLAGPWVLDEYLFILGRPRAVF